MDFESTTPSVVKSIRQRDLLNTWLRLYVRQQQIPAMREYQPARLEEELPDLVYYTVEADRAPPRLVIQSDGTRLSNAYGQTGKGRYLDEYLGARIAPSVMPVYYTCVARALPVYTISEVKDVFGRVVAYERLLLPFQSEGRVGEIIASLKTICADGAFEINNLMRRNDAPLTPHLAAVIDRELFHRIPGRRAAPADTIVFG